MAKFIGIEIMAANALIYNLENNKKDSVTLNDVEKYSNIVSQKLNHMGCLNTVLYGVDRFADYEEYFNVDFENSVIRKRDKITLQTLRDRFRMPLSAEVFVACVQTEKDIKAGKTFQDETE